MMNILIVLDRYYPISGGIQQYIRGLSLTLRTQGHQITLLTQSIDGLPEREEAEEALIIRTKLLNNALEKPELMLERWEKLIPYIKEIQPDIVYANNHSSIGSIKAAKASNVPVIYVCHGWGLFCPLKIRLLKPDNSLCYNERSLENCLACRDMISPPVPPAIKGFGRTLIKSIYWRLNWQKIRRNDFKPTVERYSQFQDILESADARIGDSFLTASFFRTKKNTYGVYYGIDTNLYQSVDSTAFREKYGLKDSPYFTLVGRVHPTKGHEWAVRALQYLPEDIKLVLIGSTGEMTKNKEHQLEDNSYTQKLKQLIASLNLQNRVIFTGLLFPDDLKQAYSGAIANVMPSVWLEAFGYVTAEAMACACPVIATQNSGAAELIEDGVEGYRIPRMNAEAIANAILKIRPERDKMGQAARRKAEQELSWSNISAQVIEIFESLIRPSSIL